MKLSENSYGVIYLTEQLKAAQAILTDTPDFFYRKVCRWYSEKFHTELTKVFDLPYNFVLQQYYESKLEERTYNEVYDYTTKELVKVFIDKEEEANKAFAQALLEEQQRTIAKKKAKEEAEAKAKGKAQQQADEDEEEQSKKVEVPEFNLNFKDDENDND